MKNNKYPRILTIVVTHNGSKTIHECLESLLLSSQNNVIVVIDNASTDDTQSIVESFSDIIFIPLKENIGFGQANNIGINFALEHGADFVFLLNQDAVVKNDTIKNLIKVAKKYPEYGILSPIHLNGDGSKIDKNARFHLLDAEPCFLSDLYLHKLQTIYSLPFVNAAAWLISSECLRIVGGFSPLFFMYGEDDDYCYRALLNGFNVGVTPNSVIFHHRMINNTMKDGLSAIKGEAKRNAVPIMVKLIKDRKNFCKGFLFWLIDHQGKIIKCLIDRNWKSLLSDLFTFFYVFIKFPEIWNHKRKIHQVRD